MPTSSLRKRRFFRESRPVAVRTCVCDIRRSNEISFATPSFRPAHVGEEPLFLKPRQVRAGAALKYGPNKEKKHRPGFHSALGALGLSCHHPGLERLPAEAQVVFISVVFNRGPSMGHDPDWSTAKEVDRRFEMRRMQADVRSATCLQFTPISAR
jgi:hypothetical protein